jgi:serine/threonine protein kinase
MPLQPGAFLGPYEIDAPLGAGSMGEVYRARDTRLNRLVAIKVLPQHLTATREARTRFEREARAIASINHPNVCTIHDVGRDGETSYLVLELVEGESLRERLATGPSPLEQVLTMGIEIADALDAAHARNIIHRDLNQKTSWFPRADTPRSWISGSRRARARPTSYPHPTPP